MTPIYMCTTGDVWSIGCILLEMVTDADYFKKVWMKPYDHLSEPRVFQVSLDPSRVKADDTACQVCKPPGCLKAVPDVRAPAMFAGAHDGKPAAPEHGHAPQADGRAVRPALWHADAGLPREASPDGAAGAAVGTEQRPQVTQPAVDMHVCVDLYRSLRYICSWSMNECPLTVLPLLSLCRYNMALHEPEQSDVLLQPPSLERSPRYVSWTTADRLKVALPSIMH